MGGKKTKLLKELSEFKEKINKDYKLKKMILFGSRAIGKYNKESDVDLIIVSSKFKKKGNVHRAPNLYLNWDLDYPVDFLCYTPEEFNKLKKQITIVREAVKEGIEIK